VQSIDLNEIINVAIGVWLAVTILAWQVATGFKRQSLEEAARNYYLQKMANYREDLENYKRCKEKYYHKVRDLKTIRRQIAEVQDDEAQRRVHPPGFLPTLAVGKISRLGFA
jgi:hypothetical protein